MSVCSKTIPSLARWQAHLCSSSPWRKRRFQYSELSMLGFCSLILLRCSREAIGTPAEAAQHNKRAGKHEKKHSIQVFGERESIHVKLQLLSVNSEMHTLFNSGPSDVSHLHCHDLKMERNTLQTDVYAL